MAKEKAKSDRRHGQAVVVTTEHRGVFFGYVKDDSDLPQSVVLSDARMAIYWPRENKGVVGLASDGPKEGSRVGPAVKGITLFGITSVMEVAPEAAERWESQPWKG